MHLNDTREAFVIMLLMLALSPDREEYAHPLSAQEFRTIREKAAAGGLRQLGELIDMDISGLMLRLDLPEEEAYRIYTLLHRDVQLGYTMENLLDQGIEIVTSCSDEYPKALSDETAYAAPPVYYRSGNADILKKPLLAIVGIGGMRTSAADKANVEELVKEAVEHGYAILTGGEPGIARVALNAVQQTNGEIVELLAGGLLEHTREGGIVSLLEAERACLISAQHPETLFTLPHAIQRNRMLFALSEAVFIFNTDGRRGEAEALRNRLCRWVYANPACDACSSLLARGAIPFHKITHEGFEDLSRNWSSSRSEQINLFDLLN